MKRCPNCGAGCSDSAKFCSSCGNEIIAAEAATASAEAATPVSDAPPYGSGTPSAGSATPESSPNAKHGIQANIENHLVKAIISTYCCCWPIGILAIVFATQVKTKLQANDISGAMEASKKANLWANVTIAVGILIHITLQVLIHTIGFHRIFMEGFREGMR